MVDQLVSKARLASREPLDPTEDLEVLVPADPKERKDVRDPPETWVQTVALEDQEIRERPDQLDLMDIP